MTWAIFGTAFLAVALWETYRPAADSNSLARRWFTNFALFGLARAAAISLAALATVLTAILAARLGGGLLAAGTMPEALRFALSFLAIDFVRYIRHAAMHEYAWLWRFHQVHHSDVEYDVATGLRFHPGEDLVIVITNAIAIGLLQPAPEAIALAEAIILVHDPAIHANARLSRKVEQWLQWFMVTPSFHRAHHSASVADQHHNYGALLPFWDKLCGTHRRPEDMPESYPVGLTEMRGPDSADLLTQLVLPFRPLPSEPAAETWTPQLSRRP